MESVQATLFREKEYFQFTLPEASHSAIHPMTPGKDTKKIGEEDIDFFKSMQDR
jgi:hypothetical protein